MLPVVPKWFIWLIKHGIQLQHHPLVFHRVLPMVITPREALLIHSSILWTAFTVVWIPEPTRATELCLWWRKLNLLGRKRQQSFFFSERPRVLQLTTDNRLATVHSDRLATQHWDIVLSLLMDLGLRVDLEKCVLVEASPFYVQSFRQSHSQGCSQLYHVNIKRFEKFPDDRSRIVRFRKTIHCPISLQSLLVNKWVSSSQAASKFPFWGSWNSKVTWGWANKDTNNDTVY